MVDRSPAKPSQEVHTSRIMHILTNHRVANLFLLLSGALAAFCLIESHVITVPYLFADEWPVTQLVSSSSFFDAVWAGHNGVPSYFQNALWWADYHWLDYRGVMPRWFQDAVWLLTLLAFFRVLRRAGLTTPAAVWITTLLVSLWFTHANRAHYLHYVWRGFETSLVFLLVAISLLFLLRFRLISSDQTVRQSIGPVAGALACAWPALYMHGGFAVLPIVALSVVLLRPKGPIIISTAAVLILFLWHYKSVHYQPGSMADSTVPFSELLFAYAVIIAAIPYQLIAKIAGPTTAGVTAVAIGLLFVAMLIRTGWRLLRKQATSIDLAAFVLMSYPAILALAAVMVRAREHGWEYVLASRYSNFSVYVLMGFSLLLFQSRESSPHFKSRSLVHAAGFCSLAIIGLLSWLGIFQSLREAPAVRNSLENYMIPYTLDPWTLPPSPMTTERRMQAAADMRADLLAGGKSVFGSALYRQYAATDITAADLSILPEEISRISLIHAAPSGQGKLALLSIAWPPQYSASSHLCIFVSAQEKAGWALPIRRAIKWQSSEPTEAQGYAVVSGDQQEVFAVIVDEQGNWKCRSSSVIIP